MNLLSFSLLAVMNPKGPGIWREPPNTCSHRIPCQAWKKSYIPTPHNGKTEAWRREKACLRPPSLSGSQLWQRAHRPRLSPISSKNLAHTGPPAHHAHMIDWPSQGSLGGHSPLAAQFPAAGVFPSAATQCICLRVGVWQMAQENGASVCYRLKDHHTISEHLLMEAAGVEHGK